MLYKAIFLDLDHTLYDYQKAHHHASDCLMKALQLHFSLSYEEAKGLFKEARGAVHQRLPDCGAKHHRLLYLQNFCEAMGRAPVPLAQELENIYWDAFLPAMQPAAGWHRFWEETSAIPKVIVTDLVAAIQMRKILRLGIEKEIVALVTSEEAGHEKPHPFIFHLALQKVGCSPSEVVMLGDSLEKDVKGAEAVGIEAHWIHEESETKNLSDWLQLVVTV